ncbi:XRE family transcriptional regulator [Paenibacillus sp. 1011MAR3C5]|uniref:helix-turn-helix domain-containing protein n=1 Tax=Paenibacillus sp. 1011MAR3C5 TaxID=1675787 RepID=UPI000E6BDFBF|nr:helix-turn-helix transcriptional regulator [Paenibacillus sp. 1011MAR3C5]RJE87048.1 XRE family transcriptional regulator [Paenibacillus sp. 1011MAR3C5]
MLTWMLRHVMAARGIWTGADLARQLAEKANYRLSPASISALLTQQPKQMKAETLDALCISLECTPNDLWVYTPPWKEKGA